MTIRMERPGLSDFTPSGLHSNLSPKNLLEEAASESFAIVSGFLSGIELQILLATDDAVNHPRPVQAVEYQGLRVPVVLRSLSTPVRHSWELIREQSPVS